MHRLSFCHAFSASSSFCVYLGLRNGPKPACRLPYGADGAAPSRDVAPSALETEAPSHKWAITSHGRDARATKIEARRTPPPDGSPGFMTTHFAL